MKLVRRLVQEERGAETVEYALVLGLVGLAAVVGLTAAGSSINTWWNSLATYLGSIPAT